MSGNLRRGYGRPLLVLRSVLDRAPNLCKMRRHLKTLCLWLLLLCLSITLFNNAARKPFWFDEIVTLRIAQCHLGPEMWHANTVGFDLTPPAIFVATRLSEMAFGRGPIPSRLPSILSGLVVLFCVFHVSSRMGGAAAGFAALFLLSASEEFWYFTEARAYALMMAGVMVAWVSWQRRVANASPRSLQLLGIFLGLAIALASHMWAVVVPACFVASAIARRLSIKVLDVAALAAMIAPSLVALSYLPLVAVARRIQFGGLLYTAYLGVAYKTTMNNMPYILLACAVVFVVRMSFFPTTPVSGSSTQNGLSVEDIVLALSLVLSPVLICAITRLMHSAFMERYVLVAVLGLTVLVAQTFSFFARKARNTCYALLFVIGLGVSAYSIGSITRDWHVQHPLGPELSLISQVAGSNEPVVYGSGVSFLQEDYYATPEMATRLVFVADRELAKRIIGTDGLDSTFTLGREYLSLRGRIVSYKELQSTYRSFWLIDSTNPLNWISEKLRADGADIRALNIPDTRISHVTLR